MRMINLKRFVKPLTQEDIKSNKLAVLEKEEIGEQVDIAPLRQKLATKIVEIRKGKCNPSDLDKELAWDLFQCFKDVPNLYLSDIRFWQWVSAEPLIHLTQFRRAKDAAEFRTGKKIQSMTDKADMTALVGGSSLNGQNRQVTMRLFLAARDLNSEALTKSALELQDRLVSTFERQIGMNSHTAQGIIEGVATANSVLTQKRVTRLNAISETTLLDYLDRDEIRDLVSQI